MFRTGAVDEALRFFDEAARLDRARAPELWQRGLALYYVGRFREASEQFRNDVTINTNDTEEAIWAMLAEARGARRNAFARARADLLVVGEDARSVLRVAYELFAGRATVTDLEPASPPEPADDASAFPSTSSCASEGGPAHDEYYALLYLALYAEAEARESDAAAFLARAMATKYAAANRGSRGDFMVAVGRVHAELRGWVVTLGDSDAASQRCAVIERARAQARVCADAPLAFAGLAIAVASASAIKVGAVRDAFPDAASVAGCAVPSGVAEQPVGVKETATGAANRLDALREACPDAELFVSFESGMVSAGRDAGARRAGRGWIDRAAIAVALRSEQDAAVAREGGCEEVGAPRRTSRVHWIWTADLQIPAASAAACLDASEVRLNWSALKDPHVAADASRPRRLFLSEALAAWRQRVADDDALVHG
jgi:non-canonical (house-cleaning) NTP pyrophosphatase